MKKQFFLPVFLLIILMTGCGSSEPEEVSGASLSADWQDQPPLAVDVLEVTPGKLVPSINASGLVEGRQEAVVVSRTQGMIRSVSAETGDAVRMDDPLLTVDNAVAELNLAQAREQLENARISLEAQERLRDTGGVSQAELLRSRSAYRGAQSVYQSSLKAYEDTVARSPLSGVITWKSSGLETGNYLSPGQALFRIADLGGIRVSLSVGERQVGLIRPGDSAGIFIPAALGTRSLQGTVRAVSAGSDTATGSYTILVESENPPGSGIRAGMSARVAIRTDDPRKGLIIPLSAVIYRDDTPRVLVSREGAAEERILRLGESLGNRQLVLEGLDPGDLLIVSGLSRVRPGSPVNPVRTGITGEEL